MVEAFIGLTSLLPARLERVVGAVSPFLMELVRLLFDSERGLLSVTVLASWLLLTSFDLCLRVLKYRECFENLSSHCFLF